MSTNQCTLRRTVGPHDERATKAGAEMLRSCSPPPEADGLMTATLPK